MLSVCEIPWSPNIKWNTTTKPEEYPSLLKEVGFDPLLHIVRCQSRGQTFPCDTIFTEVITSYGICYTYNMIDSSEMFRDEM